MIRSILEASYEPQFSEHFYGFMPHRSSHTALDAIWRWWRGTKWFIEGDITKCFDKPDHDVTYSDTIGRLMKQRCEMCGIEAEEGNFSRIQSHHIHKLADLNQKGNKPLAEWKKAIIAKRRRTLIVCVECHQNITAGRALRRMHAKMATETGEPDDMKVSRPVRRGSVGKGQ
jgi:hypothetical protein